MKIVTKLFTVSFFFLIAHDRTVIMFFINNSRAARARFNEIIYIKRKSKYHFNHANDFAECTVGTFYLWTNPFRIHHNDA